MFTVSNCINNTDITRGRTAIQRFAAQWQCFCFVGIKYPITNDCNGVIARAVNTFHDNHSWGVGYVGQ